MKGYIEHRFFLLGELVTVAAALLLTVSAHAQGMKTAEVRIDTPLTPVKAVGILLGDGVIEERAASEITRDPTGGLIVAFPYSGSDTESFTTATALVVDEAGRTEYGNVIQLFQKNSFSPFTRLAPCPKERTDSLTVIGQFALLESLLKVRDEKRGLIRQEISRILSNATLEKLRGIEKGFGLEGQEPLSPDLPPLVLVERLSRVKFAIESYEVQKKRLLELKEERQQGGDPSTGSAEAERAP